MNFISGYQTHGTSPIPHIPDLAVAGFRLKRAGLASKEGTMSKRCIRLFRALRFLVLIGMGCSLASAYQENATATEQTANKAAKSRALGSLKDEYLELAATALDFRADYGDVEVPEGWRCAVIKLSGKSLSGSATKKDIVQIEPTEYVWLATKNGHFYYSCGGSTTDDGFICFTPDFFQSQEVAFVVPASEKEFIGFRSEGDLARPKLK
jgi:hypothetical protein